MMTEIYPNNDQTELKTLTLEQQEQYNEIIMSIQRDINILGEASSDRLSKRRALEKINRETIGRKKKLSNEVLYTLFNDLSNPLIKSMGDTVEKCRELSTQILTEFITTIDPVSFIPYLMPVLVNRYSQPEIIEPSEEIRLGSVELILKLSEISKREITPFVEDIVHIVERTLQDPYPEVKKVSCRIIISLVENAERQVSYFGEKISKALLPTLQHRHSSVRVIALQALNYTIKADATGLNDIMDTLRALSLDKTGSVRETLYKTIGDWLLTLKDRYSFGDKLLPILFSGFVDEVPKYQELCKKYMNDIGALYEYDWEDRLKDQLDYTPDVPGVDRPRIGARHVVRDNILKIVNKLLEDIQDWTAERRIKSSQILIAIIPYVEEHITGYTGTIIPILCKVCTTDEVVLLDYISKATELIGHYVEPSVWLDVITPQIKKSAGGAVQSRLGCLKVLGALIHGSDSQRLSPKMNFISSIIGESEFIHNENSYLLSEISKVIQEIIEKLILSPPTSNEVSANNENENLEETNGFIYFYMLIQLQSSESNLSVPGIKEMQTNITKSMHLLSEKHGFQSIDQLYSYYFDTIMKELKQSIHLWNNYSIEPKVYCNLLENSGEMVGQRLDIIISNFVILFDVERDFETRMRMFSLLLKLLKARPLTLNSSHQLVHYSKIILSEIFIKNGIWRAGKKATQLRSKNMECLLAYLAIPAEEEENESNIGVIEKESISLVFEKELLPVLISNLEDDEVNTRDNVLKIFSVLFGKGFTTIYNAEIFKKIYPELLKRMDDANDSIRIQTTKTWKSLFPCIKNWQEYASQTMTTNENEYIEKSLDDVHWQTMIKGLSIHLDDSNNSIQNAVCETFKSLVDVCNSISNTTNPIELSKIPLKTLIIENLNAVRSKHRSSYWIDNIIHYAQQ